MSSSKKIEEIDEEIVDYTAESDDGKSTDSDPENLFRRRAAPDLGTADGYDSTQPQQGSVLREDDVILVRGSHAFRGVNLPMEMILPKVSTHQEVRDLLHELFPDLGGEVQWDLTEGNFRNVLDFLASVRVSELSKILNSDNLPITHGVQWGELGRDYRSFRSQSREIDIYKLLDHSTDEEEVTLLTLLDHSNIIRNMSMEDTRRTNHVLSEWLIWTKYLQHALQHMYEVGGDKCDENETLKDDLASAEAKLASKEEELLETHEEVSRARDQEQQLRQQVADMTDRAKQIKEAHLEALSAADERARQLERAKADSEHSLKGEITRLTRQLGTRGTNTPMSALTRSLPGANSNTRRGRGEEESSVRLESTEATPQRGRQDSHSGSSSVSQRGDRERPSTLVHSIAHEAKYLKGSNISKEDVNKFVTFLERYNGNGEYVQGGISKFIDTAATKTITMRLRYTQVGAELLKQYNWANRDAWRDSWSIEDIIAGLKEAFARPSTQQYSEIDDIWEKKLDGFELSATVDPKDMTSSIQDRLINQMIEFKTNQAPPSKEMDNKCLDRFEKLLVSKRNPKRYNDTHKKFQSALEVHLSTSYYKEERDWDMLLNHYYDVLYDWQRQVQSLVDMGFPIEMTTSQDRSKGDNRSSQGKSDKSSGKSKQLDGYTVSYHPCTYCGKNHSPSTCQLINHPESNKKGEWVNSASYKKCKELFLKDTSRLKSFPTLPMYKDTAGNAVTYELTNKSDETTKVSGKKRVSFSDKTNDKDRSRSDYSKRPRDDAKMEGQDGRKYGGEPTIAYLSSVICKCDDIDHHAIYRKCCLSINGACATPAYVLFDTGADPISLEDVMARMMITIVDR